MTTHPLDDGATWRMEVHKDDRWQTYGQAGIYERMTLTVANVRLDIATRLFQRKFRLVREDPYGPRRK
jgi:hypothetical protein